jgi:hypothetical protein
MDLRTPVSRSRHVGALVLVFLSLVIGACNRPPQSVPEVQGKKPVSAEAPPKAEKPEGFALASGRAGPCGG